MTTNQFGLRGDARGTTDLDAEAFGAIAGRTFARLAKQIEWALTPFELTLPQYRLLALLADGAAMSSSLAERLAVKPPTVTSVVDGLVVRGLVERHPDPNDRRRLPLALSEQGIEVVTSANTAVGQRLLDILGDLDDPENEARAQDSLETWQRSLDIHVAKREAEKAAAR